MINLMSRFVTGYGMIGMIGIPKEYCVYKYIYIYICINIYTIYKNPQRGAAAYVSHIPLESLSSQSSHTQLQACLWNLVDSLWTPGHMEPWPQEVIGFGTSGDHLETIIRRSYQCLIIFPNALFKFRMSFFTRISNETAHQSKQLEKKTIWELIWQLILHILIYGYIYIYIPYKFPYKSPINPLRLPINPLRLAINPLRAGY